MEKIWKVAKRKYDDLLDQLLANRDILDEASREEFFTPSFSKNIHDPYLMKNMEKAVKRIQEAKENDETVGIFADYDADGIPAAALLYRAFEKMGLKKVVYIPNRENGYGLSNDGIDYLVAKKCSLIVTVDLGIRSLAEAKYCQEIGIDLIITDHHLPGDEIPEAFLVINPKQIGDKYPCKELCGCAVGYKLVEGLAKVYPKELDEKFLKWNLDLVAISTICDMVPLVGENRVLAKYGLMVIKKTKNLGLLELIKVANIETFDVSAYHVGFQIGPRINAPGRIDHATKSFELLVTEDPNEAKELAVWLNEKNEERQNAMQLTQEEAIKIIDKDMLYENKIIVVAGDWQKGVIGPSASKLVEKYGRPVIVFAREGDFLTGSARSVGEVNIVDLFEKVADLTVKFGGHKGAAGITIEKAKYDKFIQKILEIADKSISEKDLLKTVNVDADVEVREMTKGLYEEISKFEPFGMANSKPIFLLKNIKFEYPKFVGKTADHFSSMVCKDGSKFKSIYFKFPYDKNMIKEGVCYDIVFDLSLDEWNGVSKLSFSIVDLKKCEEH